MVRKIEAVRDRIMFKVGTDEPFIHENLIEIAAATDRAPVAMHWRKPLALTEVNRMAPTADVRERRGRA